MVGLQGASTAFLQEQAEPDTTAPFLPHAREFESILLTQWLQGAESSFGSVPGGDDDQDAGGEQFKSFAVQQLAKDLTDSGGFGIAKLVAKALAHSAAGQPAAAGQLEGGTK